MTDSGIRLYFQSRLVIKQPNELVDPLLLPTTLSFLHTVGLPNDEEELNFVFDAQMSLLPNGLVRLHGPGIARPVYLSPQQGDALFSSGETEDFINSGVREFAQCLYELEYYYTNIAGKEVFGNLHDNIYGSQNRRKYAAYLEEKISAVDPAVFKRGYYWPSFIEQIADGGI